MKLYNLLRDRLRALAGREKVIHDIDREMRLHVDLQTDANIAAGMSPDEARQEALRSFGNVNKIRDTAYDVRGGGLFETLSQDIRYGARVLIKHRTFTTIAVLTLGLGIGANTAIFSVVNELLLRPLPYRDASRIVTVWEVSPEGRHQNSASPSNFRSWLEQNTSFQSLAAFTDQRINVTGNFEPEEVSVQLVTPPFFQTLGVEPILGRTFVPGDDEAEKRSVTILSYGLWQRRFGGQPDIIGKQIKLNGLPISVIGVMPRNFQFYIQQRSGTGRPAELWSVLPLKDIGNYGRFLGGVARLKPGVSPEQASAEMKTIASRGSTDDPAHNLNWGAEALPLREQFYGNVRRPLWILLGAVGFVLLIACANVANLLLSLASSREKEIALRSALGARRVRIVRQLLTESLLLAGLGSVVGLGFGWLGIKGLVLISPRDLVNLHSVGLNIPVMLWTLVVALITGVLFGLTPALHITRLNLIDSLKEGGRGEGGQASNKRIRSIFVVSEIALAVVLLAGAGLLVKSFINLEQIDRGFNADNVLTMVLRLSDSKYSQDPQVVNFFRDVLEHTRTLPGVRAAGIVNYLPFYGGLGSSTGFTVVGRPAPPPGQEPSTNVRVVDAGYFEAFGIPVLRGRNFSQTEVTQPKRVVLINEVFARRYFPGEDPIGKTVDVGMFDQSTPTEIVGVVGNVRYESLIDDYEPYVYFAHPDLTYSFMTLVIRTDGDPASLAPAVQREIRALDPNQPVSDVRTMNQVMSETVSRARFNTLLLGLFA
ncbi:MAG TPA: ABC transporter permease, partial [Pyrinomonadaceae bacterium]